MSACYCYIEQNDDEYSSLGILSREARFLCSCSRSPATYFEAASALNNTVTSEALLLEGRIGAQAKSSFQS